ncbi:HD-GYP domain-containing protein [Sphingomonadaceae bacterium LXI357]|uniref:HD-GYP domain-containing protein n=2 Tax=Stakelama marina TaxID=2826939 RepID=A0A8T4I990_9SPHN|nr:HD-GYP domain-containing protein [Stakelama marina]
MYIDSFDGSWFDHPFWRTGFLLTADRDLAKIRDSSVTAVVIDVEKGADVGPETGSAPRGHSSQAPAKPASPPMPAKARTAEPASAVQRPSGQEQDYEHASQLVLRSKREVKRMFAEVRLGRAVDAERVGALVDDIAHSVVRNPSALINLARLKSKDEYTYMHSVAVCALMINLARHLKLDEKLIRDIGMAGMLHDVGKTTVPDTILRKAGPLTDSEFEVVKRHTERGYRVLQRSNGVPDIALDVSRHHHERVDGSGYPFGLKGNDISIYSRMAAICDVYDATTSDRPYKNAWKPPEALAQMRLCEGQFDEDILSVFIQSIGIYPVGTLVRLNSGLLAIVVEERDDDFTCPVVSSFFRVSDRRRTIVQTRRVDAVFERILCAEDPADWGFDDWETLRDTALTQASRTTHRAA